MDGLQRISSLLEYTGQLKDENGALKPPLVLEGLQYVESLEGTTWSELSEKMQRGFKKNTLPFIVMQNETTEIKKYQLFQRLNRGGSELTEAEVRNCIILMEPEGRALMDAIDKMYNNKDFQVTTCLNERKRKEKADFDLVIRYLCLKHSTFDELMSMKNLGDFLNNKISALACKKLDYNNEIKDFENIFAQINLQLSKIAFRRWDESYSPAGQFLMAQYESVIFGILRSNNFSNLKVKLEKLVSNEVYKKYSAAGQSVTSRWRNILEVAEQIFKDE